MRVRLTLLGPCKRITYGLQGLTGCIPPRMHCRYQHCWKLLHLFASICSLNICFFFSFTRTLFDAEQSHRS